MASEYPLSLIIKAVDKATGPLREINAKLRGFTAPVRKLNNSLRALSEEAGLPRLLKGFTGVGKALGNVGSEAMSLGLKIATMAAGAGIGLYAIVRGAVDAGDKLNEMAQRVGLSVDAYAQLQFAAAQANVEQEAFNSAMDQFNKRLGEAKAGGGPLLEFLLKVSPALANAIRTSKSTEEGLRLMTDAFEAVQDPGKRAALAAVTFGKSGLQMGQFLGQGSKAIDEQRRRFLELAGSQAEFAAGANDLDNAIRETETSFLGLRTAAAAALFPALTELARAITSILAENRGSLKAWATETGAAISAWVKGGGLQQLVAEMKSWRETITRVIDALGGLKGVLVLVGVYLAGSFIAAVGGAVAALWSLGTAAVPVVVRAFMALAPVAASAAGAIWGAAAAVGGFLVSAAPFIAAAGAVGAAGYAIWKNWSVLMEGFTTWTGYLNTFRTALDLVIDPLESLKTAGQWWGKELGFTGQGPMLGAATAAPPPAAAAGGTSSVAVSFDNLPKGARVTQAPGGTVPLDLSMGWSMVGP